MTLSVSFDTFLCNLDGTRQCITSSWTRHSMGDDYRGTGGRKRKRPQIIAPFSKFFKNFLVILITVLVYCFPT